MIRLPYKIIFCCLLIKFLPAEPLKFEMAGESAILMNADTGAILYEKDSDKLIYPASATKIATALYALKVKANELDEVICAEQESLGSTTQEAKRKSGHKLPPYWLERDGMHIGIKKGEELPIRELLAAALIPSANDAANVLAQGIATTVPLYMDQLNAYLKKIGCRKTHFLNPHGLHHPDHQSTAYDLAIMAKEALKEPYFCELVIKQRYTRPKTKLQVSATYLHNNLLIRPGKYHYPKAIGIKTGYHAKAKSVIVAGARSNNRTLIAVLTGYSERKKMFLDATRLFETAFNQPKIRRTYLKAGEQSFKRNIQKGNKTLQTYLLEDVSLEYFPAEDPIAKCQLLWRTLPLPIRKNQVVADLQLVTEKGVLLKQTHLLAKESVSFSWPYNWARRISLFFKHFPILSGTLLAVIVLSIGFSCWIVLNRRE